MTSPLKRSPEGPGFTVAAVILFDDAGRVLTVRKHGTTAFMLPGGKLEPGEVGVDAAVREVREELGLVVTADDLESLGERLTATANEPGHWLRSFVFALGRSVSGAQAAAEIAEVRWWDPTGNTAAQAPLTRALLPAIRARSAAIRA